jgi:hypothetical protein
LESRISSSPCLKVLLTVVAFSLFIMTIPMALIMAWPVIFAIAAIKYCEDEQDCCLIFFVPIVITSFNVGLVCNVIAIPLTLLVFPFVICY